MTLSILCVTKAEKFALEMLVRMREQANLLEAELVIVQDGETLADWVKPLADNYALVRGKGYIESVLDMAIDVTSGAYVLRMDDDESISPEMMSWLLHGKYKSGDHWAFPRKHLWQDGYYIASQPLYPDLQTRLSTREKSGGRHGVHDGSPYGTGKVADVSIWHHKFRLRNLPERRKIAAKYDQLREGGGTGLWHAFNLPEEYYKSGEMRIEKL